MQGLNFYLFFVLFALLLSYSAVAEEVSGKTADGCTYKIINGQYMTSCPPQGAGQEIVPDSSLPQRQMVIVNSAPVTSYSEVPVHKNYAAAAPSIPPKQPAIDESDLGAVSSALERVEKDNKIQTLENEAREYFHPFDQTYIGLQLGGNNMTEANAGSSLSVGLNLGSNMNETFAVELGYTYAKQKMNLALASRGVAPGPDPIPPFEPAYISDSSLSSNLFTLELLAHLTNPLQRIRPFLGGGLGWRTSTLTENTAGFVYGQSPEGTRLHQSTLGLMGDAGTKLRINKSLGASFAFRYFLPVVRQKAHLEQPVSPYPMPINSPTKLTKADEDFTGSSQYQILGALQFLF